MGLEDEANLPIAQLCLTACTEAGDLLPTNLERSPRGRRFERTEDLEQGRLACTTCPNDGDNLTWGNGEVNALEHLERAEALVDVGSLDNHSAVGVSGV